MRHAGRFFVGWGKYARRFIVFGVIAVVCIAVSVVLFSSFFQVRSIRILGERRLDRDIVERTLAPLRGRHILLISSQEVANLLRKRIPDVVSVTMWKSYFPSGITLRVTMEPLLSRLRFRSVGQQAGTGSSLHEYLTEERRYIVTSIAQGGEESLPVITVADMTARPEPGAILVSEELLSDMQQAERVLQEDFGQQVVARTLYVKAREFHLAVGSLSLWFDTAGSLEDELNRYRLFLKSAGPKGASMYVDLRIAGRVVYK